MLAPTGSAPRPDISPSYHRDVEVTNCSYFQPVRQETHSWSHRPPATKAQFAALVIASMMKFSDAVDERTIDVLSGDLATDSTS